MLSNDANLIFFHTAALDLWDDYRSWILAATGFYGELFFSITTTFNVMIIIYIWTNNVVHHQKTLEKTRFFFDPPWILLIGTQVMQMKRATWDLCAFLQVMWPLQVSSNVDGLLSDLSVVISQKKNSKFKHNLKCIFYYVFFGPDHLQVF